MCINDKKSVFSFENKVNNKGSVLLFSTIIFTFISMISISAINLSKTSSEVINLEYEEMILEEEALSFLELTISNIAKDIDYKLSFINSKEEFESYFNSSSFIENVIYKDEKSLITFIKLENLKYKIISKYGQNGLSKSFEATMEIENPFDKSLLTTTNSTLKSNDLLKIYNYHEH